MTGFLLFIVTPFLALAQTDPVLEDSNIRPFTASGSISISANTYTASGIANRRAPASLQSTANLNFTVLGFSSGLNMLYSTDQSEFRQNMNNISFDATWQWITLQAGDVNPSFSKYGISGATIRGGYLKLDPGNWLFEIAGGRSNRKIANSTNEAFRQAAFERWSMAGKFGYDSGNSHFLLSTHYSLDESESLSDPVLTIAPQENLTLTPNAKVTLFDQKLSLESEVTVSAYTRDLNSAVIPVSELGLPGFVSNIMQVHESSRVNFAGEASANLSLNNFGLQMGYERIQPGFRSLGIGRIQDDQQKIRLRPSVQLFNDKASIQSNIVLGRDNLLNSRLQTRRNTSIGTNIQVQATDLLTLSANYNLMVNNFTVNENAVTSVQTAPPEQKQISHVLTFQPTLTVRGDQNIHNVSLAASYFNFNLDFDSPNGMPTPMGTSTDTYSSSLSYSLTFPSGLSLNVMGNFLKNESQSTENNTLGGNGGASYSMFEQKLTISLNAGFNQNTSTTTITNGSDMIVKTQQYMLNLMGNYRISSKDLLSLSLRSRGNSVIKGGSSNYAELEANIKYQHRF